MTKPRSKIWVPTDHYRQVNRDLKAAGVKFYPFIKIRNKGYNIEFEPANHPLITFLLLKYNGVEILN